MPVSVSPSSNSDLNVLSSTYSHTNKSSLGFAFAFVCFVCSLLFVVYSWMYLLLLLLLYLLLCVGSIIICFLINAGGLLCSRAVL